MPLKGDEYSKASINYNNFKEIESKDMSIKDGEIPKLDKRPWVDESLEKYQEVKLNVDNFLDYVYIRMPNGETKKLSDYKPVGEITENNQVINLDYASLYPTDMRDLNIKAEREVEPDDDSQFEDGFDDE
jgi:hypothetical protein